MKITIISLLWATCLLGQETFTEYEKLSDGIEIERIKNSDLKVIKEVYKNKSGQIIQFYNYNPQTNELDGEFDNGIFKGYYSNNLVTSEDYIHFLNPNNTSKDVLLLKGKIIKGKFEGKYFVFQRSYETEIRYDETSTREISYLRGEYTATYTKYINQGKYTDKIVGEIVFENGLYKSFQYKYENKMYKGIYLNGFLDYYSIRNISDNRIIDSIKVEGKLFVEKGIFKKNEYSSIIDTLNNIMNSDINNIDYLTSGFDTIGFDNNTRYFQYVPLCEPLNHTFGIVKRENVNENESWMTYVSKGLNMIVILPTSGRYSEGYESFLGLNSTGDNPGMGSHDLISCIKINKLVTCKVVVNYGTNLVDSVLIPFFEYKFDLQNMINLSGTIMGYSDYYKLLYNSLGKDKMLLFKKYSSIPQTKMIKYTYNVLKSLIHESDVTNKKP